MTYIKVCLCFSQSVVEKSDMHWAMQAFSYKPNIKAGLFSYLCGSVTFFSVWNTKQPCLGKYEGKKTTVKKYENIGLW